MKAESHLPIVRPAEFLRSTRESGYRSTPLALAELVDNSIEANAKRIEVRVIPSVQDAEATDGGTAKVHELVVLDDGDGMDADALSKALAFGGSSRYGSREGMGRFGMGLPNASLSQCRHVEVYSWQNGKPKFVSMDLDAIVQSAAELLSPPTTRPLPLPYVTTPHPDSGTAVVWKKPDRLDRQGLVLKLMPYLRDEFGRIYRHFIGKGVKLVVAGETVTPIDPLYLTANVPGDPLAEMFGAPAEVDIPLPDQPGKSAKVTVTCSILPWEWQKEWRHTGQDEKDKRHFTETVGLSIVRGHREIKIARNPYHARHWTDAWYRVEVRFPPELDEVFGVTHTKQDVKLDEHTAAYAYLEPVIVPRVQQMRNLIVERRAKHATKPAPVPRTPAAEPKPDNGKAARKGPPTLRLTPTQPLLDQMVPVSSLPKFFKDIEKKLSGVPSLHRLQITVVDLGAKKTAARKKAEPAPA